jgi:hypothetical protein
MFQESPSPSEIVDLHRHVRFGAFCAPPDCMGVMFEQEMMGAVILLRGASSEIHA